MSLREWFWPKRSGEKNAQIVTSKDLADAIGYGEHGLPVTTTEQASRLAPVYSCARVIAESLGQLPVDLRRVQGDRRFSVSGQLSYLLNVAPNEYITGPEFWEAVGYNLALRGNFYALKTTVGGELRELWPFPVGAVTPKMRQDRSLWYEISYKNGASDVLPADRVFHCRLFSEDGIEGLSPVGKNRESLGLAKAAQNHGARVFSNGTALSGTLETDGTLTDEAFDRLKRTWADSYSGEANAHKVAILEMGLQFKPRSMTNEDAEYLATRQYQRSEIAGIFRIPPHMIGDNEHSTFSNVEQQALQFVTFGLMPYLRKIEARIVSSLVAPQDRTSIQAKFNATALLRGDTAARGQFYKDMIGVGAISPNDVRALEDMNPREGGDVYLTPANMLIDGALPARETSEDA